uniref:Uncharacterized protein n=2 Tax=Hordeum vulgare subsp. vulgare TaxID=112509 RepID=M0YYM9_HORVV
MCPFLRLAGTTANYAIIDAARTVRNAVLHVVDLGGADPAQWLLLLRLFAKRPGAGAHDQILRLTIVNEDNEFLSGTAALLAREAKILHIALQFHPVKLHIDQLLSIDRLGVRGGEALFIVSTLQLHRLLADGFAEVAARPDDRKGKRQVQAHATMTRADALLRDLAGLSPKLMVVTEQEADHNGDFKARFENALNYYGALFDALEESVPARGSALERADVERCLLLQEIRDIVACDGAQRRERHEWMVKWADRMQAAGFEPVAMRADTVAQTVMLGQMLAGCSRAYRVISSEKDVCFFICWRDIPMFSVSTWRAV